MVTTIVLAAWIPRSSWGRTGLWVIAAWSALLWITPTALLIHLAAIMMAPSSAKANALSITWSIRIFRRDSALKLDSFAAPIFAGSIAITTFTGIRRRAT